MDPVAVAPATLRVRLPVIRKAAAYTPLLAAAIPPPSLAVAIPATSVVFWQQAMALGRPRDSGDRRLATLARMGKGGTLLDQRPARARRADPVVGAADKDTALGDMGRLLATPLIAAHAHSLAAPLIILETSRARARPRLGPP